MKRLVRRLTFQWRVLSRCLLVLPAVVTAVVAPRDSLWGRFAWLICFIINFGSIEIIYWKLRQSARRVAEIEELHKSHMPQRRQGDQDGAV